jgi:hypothetical protein
MRVTVTHNKGLQGVIKTVNDSSDQLLASAATGPVTVTDVQKNWDGSTMHFSFTGKMGFFTAPIRGYVQCAEKDVTIDVELPGPLKHLVPEEKVKAQVESRVRGLLNS